MVQHIHVDDEADFEFERTPLALSVADADNIDRFDAYRLYEGIHYANYLNLPINEQDAFLIKRISRLEELKNFKFATLTAQKMWEEKIDYQINFLRKLKAQIEISSIISMFPDIDK